MAIYSFGMHIQHWAMDMTVLVLQVVGGKDD